MTQWMDIRNIIFPVGYIWISTEPTSPASLFGGTWERMTNKYLLCVPPRTDIPAKTKGSALIEKKHLPLIETKILVRALDTGHVGSPLTVSDEGRQFFNITTTQEGAYSSVETLNSRAPGVWQTLHSFGDGVPFYPQYRNYYCWRRLS